MTPLDVALRLIRQRDTTTSHPDFIAAYLAAEQRREWEAMPVRTVTGIRWVRVNPPSDLSHRLFMDGRMVA